VAICEIVQDKTHYYYYYYYYHHHHHHLHHYRSVAIWQTNGPGAAQCRHKGAI